MDPASAWNTNAPLVIAHRGACQRAPENTLAAFRLARELGADAIELDAKLTADGVAVVLHDKTVDRTTSGTGPVARLTLAEVRALDAGASFEPEYAGERVPTLEEVFDLVGRDMLINVEMTNYARPLDSLPDVVVDLVRDFGLQRRVLLSSFSPVALRRAHNRAPDLPLGLLVLPKVPGWVRGILARTVPHDAFHPHEALVEEAGIQRWHGEGRKVFAWTVNEPRRMAALVRMGIDGIITDVPEAARQVVDGLES